MFRPILVAGASISTAINFAVPEDWTQALNPPNELGGHRVTLRPESELFVLEEMPVGGEKEEDFGRLTPVLRLLDFLNYPFGAYADKILFEIGS